MNNQIIMTRLYQYSAFSFSSGFILLVALLFLALLSWSCENEDCRNVVCFNGGGCAADTCHCPRPWYGPDCTENTCDTITCLNGGFCVYNSGICACPRGFMGSRCQTFWNDGFLGKYVGRTCDSIPPIGDTLKVSAGQLPYLITVHTGTDSVLGEVHRSLKITFENQNWEGGEIEGTGSLGLDTLGNPALDLDLTYYPSQADTLVCNLLYARQ